MSTLPRRELNPNTRTESVDSQLGLTDDEFFNMPLDGLVSRLRSDGQKNDGAGSGNGGGSGASAADGAPGLERDELDFNNSLVVGQQDDDLSR